MPLLSRRWRLAVLGVIIAVALAAILASSASKFSYSELKLTTCFRDAGGLQSGAEVRIAGVRVGRVKTIRAQPGNHSCPAWAEMVLATPYELKVGSDSIATTQSAGLLGGTYIEIDSSKASGPAVMNGGELTSRSSEQVSAGRLLDELNDKLNTLDKTLRKEPCEAGRDSKGAQSGKP